MGHWQGAMESLGVIRLDEIYRGRRVLVTGHTGFKGSWLALWLHELGARVVGFALPPVGPDSHWDLLKLPLADLRHDVRDLDALIHAFRDHEPEVVFHLAAQPLVRRSYLEPVETWSTNVLGTVNVLEACRLTSSVRAAVFVTTDKCYENREWSWGYRENDRLGGHDPYSASKAGAELAVASYRRAHFGVAGAPLVATARAGNVIGGGDWSEDRLVPDLVRSVQGGHSLAIRSPGATRPWQHVLDALHGYLLLGSRLLRGERAFADAWNFGPDESGNRTVSDVLDAIKGHWPEVQWQAQPDQRLHEAQLLHLDSTRARRILGWQPVWNIDQALHKTADWYQALLRESSVCSRAQLLAFAEVASAPKD
jgi:CDP-glucose 4,6-dehydratase